MSALARAPRHRAMSRQTLPSFPSPLAPALRTRIEAAIEALLAVLDAADPDPDLEPSFGYLPNGAAGDECEPENDLNESEERHHA